MLCKRNERDLKGIVKLMLQAGGPEGKSQGDFVVEEKLDGERMQLHKKGNEYRYWSRFVLVFSFLRLGCLARTYDVDMVGEQEG